jgi:hypothetical protein
MRWLFSKMQPKGHSGAKGKKILTLKGKTYLCIQNTTPYELRNLPSKPRSCENRTIA